MSDSEVVSLLRGFSPFDSLDEHYVQQVAEHAKLVSADKGKLLFRRGKRVGFRYYLLDGRVDLVDSDFTSVPIVAGEERASLALTDTSPTQVSAVAKSPVRLLQVESDFLDLAMAWSQSDDANLEDVSGDDVEVEPVDLADIDIDLAVARVEVEEQHGDWMSSLLSSPLFTQVPPAHIQQLFTRFEAVEVAAGDEILKEGAGGDYFYVLEQGRAHVTSITGQVDVALTAGEFFGEEALVADTPRNATVTMLSDGLLMRLSKEDFITLLHEPIQKELTMVDVNADMDRYQLLDVRMPLEYRLHHVPGSRNIPLMGFRDKLMDLDRKGCYVITDDAGRRSHVAAYLLCQAGLEAYILQASDQHYCQSA